MSTELKVIVMTFDGNQYVSAFAGHGSRHTELVDSPAAAIHWHPKGSISLDNESLICIGSRIGLVAVAAPENCKCITCDPEHPVREQYGAEWNAKHPAIRSTIMHQNKEK
jgi:hypothetical protein